MKSWNLAASLATILWALSGSMDAYHGQYPRSTLTMHTYVFPYCSARPTLLTSLHSGWLPIGYDGDTIVGDLHFALTFFF